MNYLLIYLAGFVSLLLVVILGIRRQRRRKRLNSYVTKEDADAYFASRLERASEPVPFSAYRRAGQALEESEGWPEHIGKRNQN